jgi:alpha 1,2-mannosyltransferase
VKGRHSDAQSALVRVTAYDPFLVMQDQGKVYGFTISLFEYIETIPSLWDSVKGECNDLGLIYAPVVIRRTIKLILPLMPPRSDFIKKYPEYIPEGNGMKFLSDDGGETYNRCHCELFICSALALCL